MFSFSFLFSRVWLDWIYSINSQGLPLNGCVHVLKDNLECSSSTTVRSTSGTFCIAFCFSITCYIVCCMIIWFGLLRNKANSITAYGT